MNPVLLVIAGPNGAGKTTVTERRTQDGLVRKVYGPLPGWVAQVVGPMRRHPDFVDLRS